MEVIKLYWDLVLADPEMIWNIRRHLAGRILGCWCRPPKGFRGKLLCHAQVLAGIADGIAPEEVS
jgi:hypothetical protein